MNLRRRTILAAGLTLGVVIVAVFPVVSWIVMSGFLLVERTLTERNVDRALDAIHAEAGHLSTKLADWAAWDDTYQFVQDRNEAYVTSNLNPKSLVALGLSLMAFIDPDGRLVRTAVADESREDFRAVAAAINRLIVAGDPLFRHADEQSAKDGLLEVDGRLVLMATRPILTSEGAGPAQGAMVFASLLSDDLLSRLAERLHMDLRIQPLSGPGAAPRDLVERLGGGSLVSPAGPESVRGSSLLVDARAEPAAVLHIQTPRFVHAQAKRSLLSLLGALIVVGAAGTALMGLVLRWAVLARLTGLSRAVSGIGSSLDLARRLPESGNDELTALAREMNSLLARVEWSTVALAESESRFRTMADTAPVLIWVAGLGGATTYVNRGWLEFTGRPSEEELGDGRLDRIHPDDRVGYMRGFRGALSERRPVTTEYRLRRHDGEHRWIVEHAAPRFGSEGWFEGYVGACTDITESRAAAERLRRHTEDLSKATQLLEARGRELESARAAAEAASRAKDEFLANMSHEIRTPMAAILGYADLLAGDGLAPGERPDCIDTIRRNGEYLISLINDILDLSKIEAGRMDTERQECSPLTIVEEVAVLLGVRAASKGVGLRIARCGPLPAAAVLDPLRFRQALTNLVGNAVKFTEVGEVVISLRATAPPERDGVLRVEVSDTGIGMSAEQLARLFRPFTQVDSTMSRRFGGTGLGLAISKSLIELMGGSIEATSREGAGSTFTLNLPIGAGWTPAVDTGPERAAAAIPASPAPAGGEELRGASILLVEDGPDNRRLISHILRRAGAAVETAEHGLAAVECISRRGIDNPFDVVLMDMQMPRMDGYDAVAHLRKSGYSGPVVALTAHAMSGDRQRCLDAGCDDYLTKPARSEALVTACAVWMSRRRGGGPWRAPGDGTNAGAHQDDRRDVHRPAA